MAKPQQRYRGVRQRHWGSWVSEIRHPLLKTRIWLGTFETAEAAARAYEEAARLMCGPRVSTNFADNADQSSSTNLLSATSRAKLHRCHMICLQMAQGTACNTESQETQQKSVCLQKGECMEEINRDGEMDDGGNMVKRQPKMEDVQHYKAAEDEHIEQMIEELLHHGSIELCSVLQS